MACDCISTIDEKLEGQRLAVTIAFRGNNLVAYPEIGLMRADNGRRESRRGKPKVMVPTFCPFCGARYEPEGRS